MHNVLIVLVSIILGVMPLPTIAQPSVIKEPIAPQVQMTEQKQPKQLSEVVLPPLAETANIPAPSQPVDNETATWNFLIGQGFSRNQTAGIMGNLQQEHNFNTSDVPGGLGIAQWMSGRRDNLMARPNYLDINVQLQYLMDELNTGESAAKAGILASDSLENAVYVFSSKFERCGTCHNEQRVAYAYQILGRH